MASARFRRRLPIGADVVPGGGVHFRVWAPRRRQVEAVIDPARGGGPQERIVFDREPAGYYSGFSETAGDGSTYRFRLDGEATLYPDPASRFQPEGPHGPSRVVDPHKFRWSDGSWRGARLPGQVIYEMHIGTFTREGTYQAAAGQLAELARLGVTMIEMMPVADFTGQFGWGYDGVDLFAPTRLYGEPDDLRRFVDEAHGLGVAVILDVVYNHLGPDGNYLKQFSDDYFTARYATDWGEAINYDGPGAQPVREFFATNAGYWIDEYHFDGLRFDATQQIFDQSAEHILEAVGKQVRLAAGGRATILIAENELQHSKLARSVERDGYGLDALWNDDFHHAAHVALTGRKDAYYTDYLGTPQELIAAVKYGYLYQGQLYKWQSKRRGTPCFDLPPEVFVLFIQNHDQVANSARGERIHMLTDPGRLRTMTALFLLAQGTPMLFQGQEFAASSPFLFFADHEPELASKVRSGRAGFLAQFPGIATEAMRARLADPGSRDSFEMCKLDLSERERHPDAYALHRDLLRLRRDDPVFRMQKPGAIDGAVLGPECLVLRWFGGELGDRLLLANFGRDLACAPAPEPLLAPPESMRWTVLWSSEDPRYGGDGVTPPETDQGWRMPGHAAIVMHSIPAGA